MAFRGERWMWIATHRGPLASAAALLAGLLLRLCLIAAFAQISGDSLIYGDIAGNWLQHGVYGRTHSLNGIPAPPMPSIIRLPGYPLFLMGCFKLFGVSRYAAVLLLQTVIDLITCWLLSLIAAGLFGPRAASAALWLAVLCPFTAIYTASPLTETLTLFCIACAYYALLRWWRAGAGLSRWLFAVSAALAYAILLRPEQGMLAACVLPSVLFIEFRQPGPRRLVTIGRPAMIAALLTILPLVPWTIRNARTFHVFQPLAPRYATEPGEQLTLGFQRWYRTWAIDFASTETIYWNYDSEVLNLAVLPDRAFDSQAQYAQTAALLSDYNQNTTADPELDARFQTIAEDRIRANPIRYYAALPVARLLDMAFRPRTETLPSALDWWRFRQHYRDSLISLSLAMLNLGYFTVAALGFHQRRLLTLNYPFAAPILLSMAATILLRCLLLLTLDNSETRYTLEFFPILIVFGAAWLGRLQSTSRRPSPDPA